MSPEGDRNYYISKLLEVEGSPQLVSYIPLPSSLRHPISVFLYGLRGEGLYVAGSQDE